MNKHGVILSCKTSKHIGSKLQSRQGKLGQIQTM